jgi:succinate dehydrogenase / fumarate reductase cytochrome b subunit
MGSTLSEPEVKRRHAPSSRGTGRPAIEAGAKDAGAFAGNGRHLPGKGTMKSGFVSTLGTSILKKQLAAVSGLMLVFFIISHLAGNLFIFGGPEAFNGYAEKLASMGPLLWVARVGLVTVFAMHIYFTFRVTLENLAARRTRYAVYRAVGERSYATRSMFITGVMILLFLFLHLWDFTLAEKEGPFSLVNEQQLGLYGLVWNRFLNPARAVVYVAAMCAVGLHLAHAVESTFQTFGLHDERFMPLMRTLSAAFGLVIALGFSSIPVYVWIRTYTIGV